MMKTVDDKLKWLVHFAGLDLATLRPGDLVNLRDDLAEFIGGGSAFTGWAKLSMPLQTPLPADYTPDDFARLQGETRALLGGLVVGRDALQAPDGGADAPQIALGAGLRLAVLPLPPPLRPRLTITGATRDMFLFTLASLLTTGAVEKLRQCPECRTIFYRIRKQIFCTRGCTNRAAQRALRKKPGARKRQRAAARRRYIAKVRRGRPNAIVTRRPRTITRTIPTTTKRRT